MDGLGRQADRKRGFFDALDLALADENYRRLRRKEPVSARTSLVSTPTGYAGVASVHTCTFL
jgi:hypothetical protein